MILKRKNIQVFVLHLLLWSFFYGLFLFPFFFQLRQIPPDLPLRLVIVIVFFYANYFLLVPKILLKKKTLSYILICLVLIVGTGLILNLGFDPGPKIPPNVRMDRFVPPENRHTILFFVNILNLSAPFFVSAFLRVYLEWKRNEDSRKKVENEKVNSELQFLKTQLNPHFLFNSLNAIYSLAVKNSNMTSEAIISLSELMRYMLYEADKEMVPLTKELEYIKNYVQLQRLRLSDSANVNLRISGDDKNKQIPPLLFISFIENAFKYGTDYQGKTYVSINFLIEDGSISFRVENKIGSHRKNDKSSGVGLENIKNRLKLLFPDSHNLLITDDGKNYCVDLNLRSI
ncbi:sensor histidine kinase [Flagellimonas baculiformis]|uniref:sensor histidine kinase n=1 Tax=Flagellimonas baculiformis TaxID=3067310 RepID=UPI00296F5371|nr:histidine kinase [Muricauda sp. D6]